MEHFTSKQTQLDKYLALTKSISNHVCLPCVLCCSLVQEMLLLKPRHPQLTHPTTHWRLFRLNLPFNATAMLCTPGLLTRPVVSSHRGLLIMYLSMHIRYLQIAHKFLKVGMQRRKFLCSSKLSRQPIAQHRPLA